MDTNDFSPQSESRTQKKSFKGIATKTVAISIIAGFLFGILGGVFGELISQAYYKSDKGKETLEKMKNTVDVVKEESAVIDVVNKSQPAVVSIIVSKDLPLIREVPMGPFGYWRVQDENGSEKQQIGGGSGFIVTEDGIVITNKHVVSDPEAEYTVLTNDEEEYKAQVLALDPVNDIAILKIESDKTFKTLSFADSESIQVGQSVIAIGNALGEFQNTVSTGVVSGLHRSITASDSSNYESEYLDGIIQTDAAINQGNSGGPLLDIAGNVIGMNTATASNGENIGFAIPSNDIKRDLEQILEHNRITTPYIGIRYISLNETIAKENNLSVDYGAFIIRGSNPTQLPIIPNSPAAKAGLEEYDIIFEIDGEKLDELNELAKIIQQKNPGDTITLKILRNDNEETITVTVEERPQ